MDLLMLVCEMDGWGEPVKKGRRLVVLSLPPQALDASGDGLQWSCSRVKSLSSLCQEFFASPFESVLFAVYAILRCAIQLARWWQGQRQ